MTTTDDTLARARERLAALRAARDECRDVADDPDFVIPFHNAAPALLDLADAVAKWRPAYDRSCCHDSAVERMDSRGEANRHLAAIDAALARLAGEA